MSVGTAGVVQGLSLAVLVSDPCWCSEGLSDFGAGTRVGLIQARARALTREIPLGSGIPLHWQRCRTSMYLLSCAWPW